MDGAAETAEEEDQEDDPGCCDSGVVEVRQHQGGQGDQPVGGQHDALAIPPVDKHPDHGAERDGRQQSEQCRHRQDGGRSRLLCQPPDQGELDGHAPDERERLSGPEDEKRGHALGSIVVRGHGGLSCKRKIIPIA